MTAGAAASSGRLQGAFGTEDVAVGLGGWTGKCGAGVAASDSGGVDDESIVAGRSGLANPPTGAGMLAASGRAATISGNSDNGDDGVSPLTCSVPKLR